MEDTLAQERAAEQHVRWVLTSDSTVEYLPQALAKYRSLCEASIFADIYHAEKHEVQLWALHTEVKQYLHKALSGLRKQGDQKTVAARQTTKGYLRFIKESQAFYRGYIANLNARFDGVPELEAVALQIRNIGVEGNPQAPFSSELRTIILNSCHRTLIYLGDLSRYRASAKLDKNPDFGPAIGYYGLACALCPASGLGQHQQAVIALEQRNHLRAIYHLYRAIVVDEPHPNAAGNLELEFDKTNAAWERNGLIQKGPPKDPDAPKRMLIGWFVRLHSMCNKGKLFRGYEELERELLAQFAAHLKQDCADSTVTRMLMINLAAQYSSGQTFQTDPTPQNQQAFFFFFRLNICTFTILVDIFDASIRAIEDKRRGDEDDLPLSSKLDSTARRLLPGLRLYSSWLLSTIHLVVGLAGDEFLKAVIEEMWTSYAQVLDLVAAAFPIWDLEDLPEMHYLQEEDVDTLGFNPIISERTRKIWWNKQTGKAKPRFSDFAVKRIEVGDEMLERVKVFLEDGLFLANDYDDAPIRLQGTRIMHGANEFGLPLSLRPKGKIAQLDIAKSVPALSPDIESKPLSYAAAAAQARFNLMQPAPTSAGVQSAPSHSRQAQLSQMVDNLVKDPDTDHPVTPPRESDVSAIKGGVESAPRYVYASVAKSTGPRLPAAPSPTFNTPRTSTQTERLQSAPSLWSTSPSQTSSALPQVTTGLYNGNTVSPAESIRFGHSRVNSANSVRSKASQIIGDSWSSLDSTSHGQSLQHIPGLGMSDTYKTFNGSSMASPLLFGAGGGPWSGNSAAGERSLAKSWSMRNVPNSDQQGE